MWHRTVFVAESRRVDASRLDQFARENEDKYGIVIEHGHAIVSTWHCDALVADFKAAHPDAYIGYPQQTAAAHA